MVCSLLPTKYETECKTLISEYEPMIVKLLINLVNPNQVCSLLRLCPKKVPKVRRLSDKVLLDVLRKLHLRGRVENIKLSSLYINILVR